MKTEPKKTKIPHRVQHAEKSKDITKPQGKVAFVKIESRIARNKAKSRKRRNRLITLIAVAVVVIISGFGISHTIIANTQSKIVVSDMKANKRAEKKSQTQTVKKLNNKNLKFQKDKKQILKSNWLAGKVYKLNIATVDITGTVNNSMEQDLALPDPRLNQPTYIVFNPDASQKTFIKVNSLKLAKRAREQNTFDAKQRNVYFELKGKTLTTELPKLDWAYPLSPYNAIQISKEGRKRINSIFSSVLTNVKLNKKSGQNSFKLNNRMKGNDFSNTTGDMYVANYQIQVKFKRVK